MNRKEPQESKPTEYKAFPFEVTNLDFEGRTLEGYVSIFGNLDSGSDIVHKGAFSKTLKERGGKVKFLWQHDSREPLGRPLELREDNRGLFVKAIVSKTRRGLDTLELLRDGAINEFSIGYDAIKGGTDYSEGTDGSRIRNLREIKLYEFSLVTFAMNEEAQVTGLKEQETQEGDSPTEGKPAPDVTENTIRIRVRNPGDFQEDSFRTIRMGSEEQGIQAVIGKLEGETSTTVQSYIFDKEKWTVEEAQAWVDEHKKSAGSLFTMGELAETYQRVYGDRAPEDVLAEILAEQDEAFSAEFEKMTDEEKQGALTEAIKQMTEDGAGRTNEGPYLCECLDCGHEAEFEAHCRDVKCPECGGEMRRKDRSGVGKEGDEPGEVKFTGSPRNPYGTHASRGYPGGRSAWKRAWRIHMSGVRAQGPVQGTIRRVSMIAAGMKPPCKIPEMSAEDLGPRSGACGKLSGDYKETPGDYGLSKWKSPSDDGLEQEDIQLTCQDLEDIKRICLKEIAKRQACSEEGKSEWADDGPQFEDKEADRIWLWEIAASWDVANSIVPPWGEGDKALNLTQRLDSIRAAFDSQYNPPNGPWDWWVNTIYDEYIIVQHDGIDGMQYFQVPYTLSDDDSPEFAPRGEWVEGEYEFTPLSKSGVRVMLQEAMAEMQQMLANEEKAGRVLAARNATRIANALTALIEVLEDAGVDIPGYGKESPDDEEAGPEEPPEKSDGPDESPTSVDTDEANRLRNQARTLELEMELMQMTTEV